MSEPAVFFDPFKVRSFGTPRSAEWVDHLEGQGTNATTQGPTEPMEWLLDFPYSSTPISPNGPHGNPRAHAGRVKAVRRYADRLASFTRIPPLGRARAELTWYVTTKRRRDPMNLVLTLKAMVVGLVDAHVTTDDTPDLMDTPMPRIVNVDPLKHRNAWMELRITRWAGPDQQLDIPGEATR